MPLRRDTTPPIINWMIEPKAGIYAFGSTVWPSYYCSDSYSTCTTPDTASPVDTWTRGRHVFTATSTDEAGNTATRSVEYLVGTDECVATPLAPGNMKRWYKFDGNRIESMVNHESSEYLPSGTFGPGVAGQGWTNSQPLNFIYGWGAESVLAGPSGLTVAMWVKPTGWFFSNPIPQYQTLFFNPMQYHVARWVDGTLRWAFNTSNGFTWVNTGVLLSENAWQHVAVTYNGGARADVCQWRSRAQPGVERHAHDRPEHVG